MKRFGYGLAVVVLASALVLGPSLVDTAQAQWVAVATMATAQTQEGVSTETIYKISPAVSEVYCNWMVLGAKAGDQISGTFVAVDVGKAAPPNYTIDTATFVVPQSESDTAWGHFSLSKPTTGWPYGLYLVEIKRNGGLVATVHFMISN